MRLGVHHYVGRLLDYFDSNEYFYQVFELEHGGTLASYTKEYQNIIPEARCRVITQKLA
jgi:serine/threonine protein kinase